ncbi:MAG: hypothetical protein AAGA20_16725 [Planctomycetota bacterium]
MLSHASNRFLGAVLAAAVSSTSLALARQCPEISNGFGSAGADGPVRAQLVVDAGGQQQLVVGGRFDAIGGIVAKNVATFDGTSWSQLGDGLQLEVYALALYDDGTGARFFASGPDFVAQLVGGTWQVSPTNGFVYALHVHDDGSGESLYAGGRFSFIDGVQTVGIARYDGQWNPFPSPGGGTRAVRAFETHDDGTGPALYIGGHFSTFGGVATSRIARWDGASLTGVGGGLVGAPVLGSAVRDMQSTVGPGGVPELHVAGGFTGAAGVPDTKWVVWTQGAWQRIGGTELVHGLTLRREAGGDFVHGVRQTGVDRWDGATLTTTPYPVPTRPTSVEAFGAAPQELFVGFDQKTSDGAYLERLVGSQFEPPVETLGLSSFVGALEVVPTASGEALVAVGREPLLGAANAAAFDGIGWTPLGSGNLDGALVNDLFFFGGDLYAAGRKTSFSEDWTVSRLIGQTWAPVGPAPSSFADEAFALVEFDDGGGPALYVGGRFEQFDQALTDGIARFDGAAWQSVGGGITAFTSFYRAVQDMVVWDDGTGEALYAAGTFEEIGGVTAQNIARWDGTQWSPLGAGIGLSQSSSFVVADLEIFDSPSGEQLVATGLFSAAGGQLVGAIAAWDGTSWSALGLGLGAGFGRELVSHDPDGSGERLYAFGSFDTAGTLPADGAAVWDGVSWAPFGGFAEPNAQLATAVFDDGAGRALFLGGSFSSFGGVASSYVARYADPCGRVLGTPRCTSTVNGSGVRSLLRASGSASVAADDAVFTVDRLPAGVLTLLVNGTAANLAVAGDGTLCVGGTLRRMYPAGVTDAQGRLDVPLDYGSVYANGIGPGTSRIFQAFFRDALGGPVGFNTTDALEIVFRP